MFKGIRGMGRRASLYVRSSESVQLVRAREWSLLRYHVKRSTKEYIQAKGETAITEVRDRHSVISLAAPLDQWDRDPAHLRDHQLLQIFFNGMVWELVWLAFMNNTRENTDSGAISLVPVVLKGLSAAATCLIVAFLSRAVFRFGNRKAHAPRLRRGQRLPARWQLRYGRCVLALSWSINLFAMAGSCWVVIAYGTCFTPTATRNLLIGWMSGLAVSWLAMEPLQIFAIASAPCIFKNPYILNSYEYAQMMGIDLGLLF